MAGQIRSMMVVGILMLVHLASNSARAAILIEEGGQPVRSTKKIHIPAAKSVEGASYGDGFEMRMQRRVGVGLSGAGPLGVGGVNLELNLSPDLSFIGGFGGGKGFQSFTMQFKHVFGGGFFMPYFMGGYARWYSVGKKDSMESTTSPAFLGEKFLSDSDKLKGQYSVNLLYPGIGVQFTQHSGPWAGSSVYVEAVMLLDVEDFVAAPTGTIGYLYYF